MSFELQYTPEAAQQYQELGQEENRVKQFKAVKKALRLLADNPRHPGLNTHKYTTLVGPGKTQVFEAYAENRTAGAWRIFWCYYPANTRSITILAIVPHP